MHRGDEQREWEIKLPGRKHPCIVKTQYETQNKPNQNQGQDDKNSSQHAAGQRNVIRLVDAIVKVEREPYGLDLDAFSVFGGLVAGQFDIWSVHGGVTVEVV